jgi:hypothetical protein
MLQHFGIIPPDPISSAGICSVPGDVYLYRFSLVISTSEALVAQPCVSVCLTYLTPYTFTDRSDSFTCSEYCQNLQANHRSCPLQNYINLCLTRPSNAFVVTVGFRFINFSFQIFTLFCSEVSVSYMSDIIKLISINWAWIL